MNLNAMDMDIELKKRGKGYIPAHQEGLRAQLIESWNSKPMAQSELARRIGISLLTLRRYMFDGEDVSRMTYMLITNYLKSLKKD